VEEFTTFLKEEKKNEINFNHHFLNLKQTIQTSAIESGKRVYYWPF
jgi:hypothetical protein